MVAIVDPRRAARFVETAAVAEIRTAIEYAERSLYPVRIIGKPGTGKTTALRYLAAEIGAVYVQAAAAHRNLRGMYQMVLAAYGRSAPNTTEAELADRVYEEIGDRYEVPTLFLDEYQTLEPRSQRELLNIQETKCFGLVLAGNAETLAERKDTAALEQILDRLGMDLRLDGPTVDDCRNFCIEFNVEGKDAYAAVENFGGKTNLRQLVALLEEARDIAGHVGSIQRKHLETALLLKRNARSALKLFEPGEAA